MGMDLIGARLSYTRWVLPRGRDIGELTNYGDVHVN
jgi:hypothetical protein